MTLLHAGWYTVSLLATVLGTPKHHQVTLLHAHQHLPPGYPGLQQQSHNIPCLLLCHDAGKPAAAGGAGKAPARL